MDIVFSYQYAPLLGLVLALMFGITIYSRKMQKARAMRFGNYDTLEKVAGGNFLRSSNVLTLVKLGAVTALIIGISGPQVVRTEKVADANYVIAVDSSSSMFTSDIRPTRFAAAKDISLELIEGMTNQSRLGIVSYSGQVNVEAEVSSDLSRMKRIVSNLSIGDTAGTAIGDAVISSSTLLQNGSSPRRVVLITDGENNVGTSINKSIRFANTHNVSIYTIGLGTDKRGRQYGVIKGNNATKADFPNLNVAELRRLSNRTGGRSIFVTNNTDVNPQLVGIKKEKTVQDFSTPFIFLGAVLIIIEWVLKSTDLEILP
ncbi:MAG: VWA domain-containing protein [Candidatus Nanohaloarchaea archaeon]